jgi:serine/threonine protein kinase/tetratricopeptide (TPR) repeat protein
MHDDHSTIQETQPTGEAPEVAAEVRKAQVKQALFHTLAPVRVGRFILLEVIGSGSMGEIYAAYDEQLDRKVALKLVRAGARSSTRADARLLREAQTLARLSHPNVVQVYEAGTYQNRVFIAMEFIHGVTLTGLLDRVADMPAALRRSEILRTFIAAGRGLEAAHRAGLAHRDFKPDNVLVGDDGRVRVVDFGLARAMIEPSGTQATATLPDGDGAGDALEAVAAQETVDLDARDNAPATDPRHGARETDTGDSGPRLQAAVKLTATGTILGTPRFMSPEQMRGQLADHRSDQFSFCVALYHALYGEWPFPGSSFLQIIASVESGEITPPRGADVPAWIRQALLRGLARDPAARFPDMTALLAALDRSDAQPRRRRMLAAGAVLAAAGAMAFAALGPGRAGDPCAAVTGALDEVWTAQARDRIRGAFARTGLSYAVPAWDSTSEIIDGYAAGWRREAADACQATHVERTQSADLFDRRMVCLARGSRQLEALVHALADAQRDTVEHAVEAAVSLPDPGACRDAEQMLLAPAPPAAPEIAAVVAEARRRLADTRVRELLGRYRQAEGAAAAELARARSVGYRPLVAEALLVLGRATAQRADSQSVEAATAHLFEALDIAEATRDDALAAEAWLALVLVARRHHDTTAQAHAWARRARAAVERMGDPPHQHGRVLQESGLLHYRDGHLDDAERMQRAALERFAGPELRVARARTQLALANTLHAAGDHDGADTLYRQARSGLQEALGAGHPSEAHLLSDHALGLIEIGRLDEARALLQDALAMARAAYGKDHLQAGRIELALANVAQQRGELGLALAHTQESLRIHEQALGAGHATLAEVYVMLGVVELRRERYDASLAAYRSALDIQRRSLGSDAPMVGVTHLNLAETETRRGQHAEALRELASAERILTGSIYDVPSIMAVLWKARGVALWALRDRRGAVDALERSLTLFAAQPGQDLERAEALWTLAQALSGNTRPVPARARDLAEEARRIFADSGAAGERPAQAIAAWLRAPGRP